MARGILAGGTDYSNQSITDIIKDLEDISKETAASIEMIKNNVELSKQSGYWNSKVVFDFRAIVLYSLKHYETTKEELESISKEIKEEIQQNHCNRIAKIAEVADIINIEIGQIWHNDYEDEDKEYGKKEFLIVEEIYGETKDMACSLLDLSNIATRLEDFIGWKGKKVMSAEKDEILKILFLSSSPSDEDTIRVDLELRKIEEALEAAKYRDNVSLEKKIAIKPETMTKVLMDFSPNIIHFSGHGDEHGIIIENDEGNSIEFPTEGLEKLFSLFSETVICVILNSCYSEKQAKAISKQGIYVIGMNDEIPDEAAIKFSVGFYQAIGANKTIDFAFDMGTVLIFQSIQSSNIPTLWKDGKKIK